MQIIPTTFEWLQTKTEQNENYDSSALFDSDINIKYGVLLLSILEKEYGSIENMAAAYHAGITAVANWLQNNDYSTDGKNLIDIPYKDTKHYVQTIIKHYNIYKKMYSK